MKSRFEQRFEKKTKLKKVKFEKKAKSKIFRYGAKTKYKRLYNNKIKFQNYNSEKKTIFITKTNLKILIIFLLLFSAYILKKRLKIYSEDNITLITALFKIKSKHSFDQYLSWVDNLLKLNCSIVFFSDNETLKAIKGKRSKIYENKTIWIETSIEQFYSYKNFQQNFIESFKVDIENSYHTVPLYMVWAEKCSFLKKAIYRNYFHSKCFYWIDAGYFRKKEEKQYYYNWPSTKRCYEDPRVIINEIRKLSQEEIEGLRTFNKSIYFNIIKQVNVAAGLFGGKPEYCIKFCDLYYKAIKAFIKNNLFIGKEQNVFAYVSYLNPKIVKILSSNKKDWYFFKKYLSETI